MVVSPVPKMELSPQWAIVVDEVTHRIIATVQPQRILLFGSVSRSQSTSDSDLDKLVIVRGPAHRRALAQEIYKNLRGILTPVYIVVATEQDIQQHGQAIGSILRPALREGVVVYERGQ